MTGVKGRSGRKPMDGTNGMKALKLIERNILQLTRLQIKKAFETGDLLTIDKLQNRLWGFPKIKSESDTKISYDSDSLIAILAAARAAISQSQQKFITANYQPFALNPGTPADASLGEFTETGITTATDRQPADDE